MGSYDKERYEYCKLNGICTACKKRPASLGRLKCEECTKRRSERDKKEYERCKANGICTTCRSKPVIPGKLRCGDCTERERKERREGYKFYKSIGICPSCRKYSAVPGRVYCEVCTEQQRYEEEKRYSKPIKRNRRKESNKKRYDRYKAEGKCIYCGKPKEGNFTGCPKCIKKRKIQRAIRNEKKEGIERSELPNYGICYTCCKNPVMEGKRLCAACYGRSMESLEIAWCSENSKKQREYFRILNDLDFAGRREPGRMGCTV